MEVMQLSKTVLMCRPSYFDVSYRINPWMTPGVPTDTAKAVTQWEKLRNAYSALGIAVHSVEPVEDLNELLLGGGSIKCSTLELRT